MAVVNRPLTPGIYAPVPSFFLPQSEDLGTYAILISKVG